MEEYECVTLDSDDEEDSKQRVRENLANSGLVRKEEMKRCNLCLDPGLLPVEEDRAAHRLALHRDKLFYCDVCSPYEKGGKGFEDYADVCKHVCYENGIDSKDKAKVHMMIRIPPKPEYLKMFTCLFCPGSGMKYVALTEENFLEHIRSQHGKASRRYPDKLVRACRICAETFITDTELSYHVDQHFNDAKNPRAARYPYAGLGARDSESPNDTSDEEYRRDEKENIGRDGSKISPSSIRSMSDGEIFDTPEFTSSKRKRCKSPSSPPSPSPARKEKKSAKRKMTKKGSPKILKQRDEAVVKGTTRKKASPSYSPSPPPPVKQGRTKARHESRSPSRKMALSKSKKRGVSRDGQHIEEEYGKHRKGKKSRKSDMLLISCPVCSDELVDLVPHLAKHHADEVFKCKQCDNQVFLDIDAAIDHTRSVHNRLESISRANWSLPLHLGKATCLFCRPAKQYIGAPLKDLAIRLFNCIDKHENEHEGKESIIERNIVYSCRMCPGMVFTQVDLDNHLEKHELVNPSDRQERDDSLERRRSGQMDQKVSRMSDSRQPSHISKSQRPRTKEDIRGIERLSDHHRNSFSSRRHSRNLSPDSDNDREYGPDIGKMRSEVKQEKRGSTKRPASPPPKVAATRRPPSPKDVLQHHKNSSPRDGGVSRRPSTMPAPPDTRQRSPVRGSTSRRRTPSPSKYSTPESSASKQRPSRSVSTRICSPVRGATRRSSPSRSATSRPSYPKDSISNLPSPRVSDPRNRSPPVRGPTRRRRSPSPASSHTPVSQKRSPSPLSRSQSDVQFKCGKCSETFEDCFPAMLHLEEVHGIRDVEESVLQSYLILPKVLICGKCKFCDKEYLSDLGKLKAELRKHREAHRNEKSSLNESFRLECRLCALSYDTMSQLDDMTSHVETHRSRGRATPVKEICNYCLQNFKDSDLESHMSKNHREQMFKCHICNFAFNTRNQALDHLAEDHNRDRNFEKTRVIGPKNATSIYCGICQTSFYCQLEVFERLHARRVHPLDNKAPRFGCRLCVDPAEFSSQQELTDHLRNIHDIVYREIQDPRSALRAGSKRPQISNIQMHLVKGQRELEGDEKIMEKRRSLEERLGKRSASKSDDAFAPPPHRSQTRYPPEWTCPEPECNYSNFNRNRTCKRCGRLKPTERDTHGRRVERASSKASSGSTRARDENDHRIARDANDRRSSGERRKTREPSDRSRRRSGESRRPKDSSDRKTPRDAGRGGGRDKRPRNWICPECNTDNYPDRLKCFNRRCEASRPRPDEASSGSDNSNLVPLQKRGQGRPSLGNKKTGDADEVSYTEQMRLAIEELQREAAFKKELAEELTNEVIDAAVTQAEYMVAKRIEVDSFLSRVGDSLQLEEAGLKSSINSERGPSDGPAPNEYEQEDSENASLCTSDYKSTSSPAKNENEPADIEQTSKSPDYRPSDSPSPNVYEKQKTEQASYSAEKDHSDSCQPDNKDDDQEQAALSPEYNANLSPEYCPMDDYDMDVKPDIDPDLALARDTTHDASFADDAEIILEETETRVAEEITDTDHKVDDTETDEIKNNENRTAEETDNAKINRSTDSVNSSISDYVVENVDKIVCSKKVIQALNNIPVSGSSLDEDDVTIVSDARANDRNTAKIKDNDEEEEETDVVDPEEAEAEGSRISSVRESVAPIEERRLSGEHELALQDNDKELQTHVQYVEQNTGEIEELKNEDKLDVQEMDVEVNSAADEREDQDEDGDDEDTDPELDFSSQDNELDEQSSNSGKDSECSTPDSRSSSSPIKVESLDHLKDLLEKDPEGNLKYYIPPEISETEEYKDFIKQQDNYEDYEFEAK